MAKIVNASVQIFGEGMEWERGFEGESSKQGWIQDFNLGDANIHIKHKIQRIHMKYDTNFSLGVASYII